MGLLYEHGGRRGDYGRGIALLLGHHHVVSHHLLLGRNMKVKYLSSILYTCINIHGKDYGDHMVYE